MILFLYLEFVEVVNKGVEYFNNGDFYKAESCFVEALKEKETAELYNFLGLTHHKQKRYNEAVRDFEKGISIDSSFIPLYINISRSLRFLKKYDEAIEYLKKGLKVDSNATILSNLGILYDIKKECHKAINFYKLSLKRDSLNASTHYNLGIAYKHCKNRDSSLIYMKKAMILYYKDGDFTRGKFVAEELLSMDSTDGVAHYYLGEMYLRDQEYEKGIHHLISAYRYDRDNLYALYRVSFGYLLMGDRLKCFDFLRKSLEQDRDWLYVDKFIEDIKIVEDNFVMFLRGYIMYRRGNRMMAEEFLNKFIEKDRDGFWIKKAKEVRSELEK